MNPASKPILIINHGTELVGELRADLRVRGYTSLTELDYRDLGGIHAKDYHSIFSIGGKTANPNGGRETVGNSELEDEIGILHECEDGHSRMMCSAHAAHIAAAQDGILVPSERKGYDMGDYLLVKNDPILDGIKVKGDKVKLRILEWHTWGIRSVAQKYDVNVIDSTGCIQIARYKNVYLIQGNPYALRPKNADGYTVMTNGGIIINNFLKMPLKEG